MTNTDTADLCEICGCLSTRFFGSVALCDNRVCEQTIRDEMEFEIELNRELNNYKEEQ